MSWFWWPLKRLRQWCGLEAQWHVLIETRAGGVKWRQPVRMVKLTDRVLTNRTAVTFPEWHGEPEECRLLIEISPGIRYAANLDVDCELGDGVRLYLAPGALRIDLWQDETDGNGTD